MSPADGREPDAPASPLERTRSAAAALPLASTGCALLVAIQLGWLPGFEHAWGFSLWRYLAAWQSALLAAAVLLLCTAPVRRALVRALGQLPLDARLGRALLIALPFLLYPLRERLAFGDSRIIYFTMHTNPATFFFPDIGATFFLQLGQRLGARLGIGGLELVQALICLMAPIAVHSLYRAARLILGRPAPALVLLGLLLGNGLIRVFAGHLEVYSFVLVSAGLYLWASFAFLHGRCAGWLPALAFGVGLWVHIQFLFLIPSLMLLYVLREPGRSLGPYLRRWLVAAPITLAPTLVFFLVLISTGHGADLEQALAKGVAWSALGPTEQGHEAWIRFWGGSGPGTRYMIFGPGHLWYLVNAFFLIAPVGLPLLAACALLSPRSLLADDTARFLSCANASMLLYAAIVRPVYGPYDWDLFALSAVLASTLAGYLLLHRLQDPLRAELATLMIGAALLFTALPLLAIGISPSRDAGPFSRDLARPVQGEPFEQSFERLVAPWL